MQTPKECSTAASLRSIPIQVERFIQATAEGEAAIRLPHPRTHDPSFVGYRTTSW
jgi:hypothetical protein